MPLANNSTGAGAGDNYNSSNPAMIAGILSPTDGDVYVYGYDDNRQQVIIRKVSKTAQVPHKGMNAHPVYTNNLLSTYIKNAVIPKTVGATHTPQDVVPTTNNFLSTYQKNAVVPTTNNFLSTYQKNGVTPTVTDFLSAYVKQAVTPVAGTQQPQLTWADPDRFRQMLQNMSGDLRRGALHGKAGMTARETVDGKEVMPLTKMRLDGLSNNPVTGSWTHALYGKAGANPRDSFNQINPYTGATTTYSNLLPTTILRLQGLANNAVTGSWTHALHGKVSGTLATYGWTEEQKKSFKQQLRNMSVTPLSGALHGMETKLQPTWGWTVEQKAKFKQQLRNMSVTPKTGALHGMETKLQPTWGWTEEQRQKFRQQLRNMSALPKSGSLHGVEGKRGSIWAKTGKFATFHTQNKPLMSSPGGGAVAGAMSAASSLISGLADTMKNMLFGGASWPMSKFYFYVMVGGYEMGFQTVEGLEAEVGVIEYRDGNSPILAKERIPGLVTYNRVTLKKGMFANDTVAASMFKEIATDRQYTRRRSIIIAMLDHNHIPQFIWRYEKCFITKFIPANLDAESENEVAVEEMEFVGRTFTTETLMGMAAGLAGGAISGALNISF